MQPSIQYVKVLSRVVLSMLTGRELSRRKTECVMREPVGLIGEGTVVILYEAIAPLLGDSTEISA